MGHELSNQYTGTFALKQSITDNRNILDKVIDIGYEIIIACKNIKLNNLKAIKENDTKE